MDRALAKESAATLRSLVAGPLEGVRREAMAEMDRRMAKGRDALLGARARRAERIADDLRNTTGELLDLADALDAWADNGGDDD